MKRCRFFTCLLSSVLCAQSAAAATLGVVPGAGVEVRSESFAGLNVTLPLGGARQKAAARLQVTRMARTWDPHFGAPLRTYHPKGLEIGLNKKGTPALYLEGRSASEIQQKLGVRGDTGTVLLIVGGVALLVILVVAAKETAGFGSLPPG